MYQRHPVPVLLAVSLMALLTFAACDTMSSADTEMEDPVSFDLASLDCQEDGVNADPFTVADAMSENATDHEDTSDYTYDASAATTIALNGTSIDVSGSGATASGSTVTIDTPGTYLLSGTLNDGQVIVNAEDDGAVKLVLNGVAITNTSDSGILVAEGDRTVLILADGTTNTVTDGPTYPATAEQNAAIWSDDDLSIGGSGTLIVDGRFEDGIASKDGLVIRDGTITVTALDEGIRGKDYLVIRSGTFDITAGGDGLKSDEDEDAELGYVLIENGVITVDAAGDAVTGETDALIAGGTLTLRSGGGSSVTPDDDASTKGIKGGMLVLVEDGTLTIDASDDGLHANGTVIINGGTIEIATADDGIHADTTLTINAGDVNVTKSYEGIENGTGDLTFNGGTVHVVSSDDGINVAGDGDTRPGAGAGSYTLRINGGRIVSNASGDGVDSNGSVVMTGGCVLVHGPTASNNGAIDYDGSFQITGGLLVATGSGRMAQAPDASSTQPAVLLQSSSTQSAGTVVYVQAEDGETVLAFSPSKAYQTIAFSAPWLAQGERYALYLGGSVNSTATDGLYEDGTYSGGTLQESFTLSSMSNTITF